MTRKPENDTASSANDRPRESEPGTAADANPNERLEKWESRYFEKPADAGRGDPQPNP